MDAMYAIKGIYRLPYHLQKLAAQGTDFPAELIKRLMDKHLMLPGYIRLADEAWLVQVQR